MVVCEFEISSKVALTFYHNSNKQVASKDLGTFISMAISIGKHSFVDSKDGEGSLEVA